MGLLRKAMEKSGKTRFLIDGFPRNPENLAAWEAAAADGNVVFEFALFLDCPEEVGRGHGRGVALCFACCISLPPLMVCGIYASVDVAQKTLLVVLGASGG